MSPSRRLPSSSHPTKPLLPNSPLHILAGRGVWAIEPTAAQRLAMAMRRSGAISFADGSPSPVVPQFATVAGKQIAVISLGGVLMKSVSARWGTSSIEAVKTVRAMASHSAVGGILLNIDSPGGTVAGTDELATAVVAANRAKPVYSFVSDLCASAAYWVACQARRVYVNSSTAWVGSIGTMLVAYDESRAFDRAGIKPVIFTTAPLKAADVPGAVISTDARAMYQGLVSASQRVFDAAVKAGRQFTASQLEAVRSGGVFAGQRAVELRLIDGIQSYEATLSGLAKAIR